MPHTRIIKEATIVMGSTILALIIAAGVANADTCSNLTWQADANASSLQRENNTLSSNTAMMNASVAAGDIAMAKFYASMGKDTSIRLIGLITEGRALLVAADNEPGNCGMSESEVKSYIKDSHDAEEALNKALATYKSTNK